MNMTINSVLANRKMTKYRLSKLSGVPQTTVIDICSGRAKIENCSSGTLYKLAKTLEVTMESLLEQRPDFEHFKSFICHKVKSMGDFDFIIQTLVSDEIRSLYTKRWYLESLYLLAMVDYLSRENGIPLYTKYDDLRFMRLSEVVYPAGIHVMCIASNSELPKQASIAASIPEFLRHNIVEAEVRNVC